MDPLCGSRYWPNLWDFATSHYHTNTEAICHMFCYSKHCNKFSFMQSYYPRYTVEICHIIRKTLSMSVVAAVASWVIKHNSKSITPTHGGGGGLAQCFCYYVCLHSSAITLVEHMFTLAIILLELLTRDLQICLITIRVYSHISLSIGSAWAFPLWLHASQTHREVFTMFMQLGYHVALLLDSRKGRVGEYRRYSNGRYRRYRPSQ